VSDFGAKKPAKHQNEVDSEVLSACRHRTFELTVLLLIIFRRAEVPLRAPVINRLVAHVMTPSKGGINGVLDRLKNRLILRVGASLSACCYRALWVGCRSKKV
jgi:hypothetical protein